MKTWNKFQKNKSINAKSASPRSAAVYMFNRIPCESEEISQESARAEQKNKTENCFWKFDLKSPIANVCMDGMCFLISSAKQFKYIFSRLSLLVAGKHEETERITVTLMSLIVM